jgi:hypothetical protein
MRKPTPIKPMGISINDPLWKRVVRGVAYVTGAVVIAALMAVFLLEWMAGCGETYTDSKGVRHANECIFIRVN